MTIELKPSHPKPVSMRKHVSHYPWKVTREIRLKGALSNSNESFIEILNRRRSRRRFITPYTRDIAEFLYLSSRTISRENATGGLIVEHRPVIASGGLHCIELLLMFPDEATWYRYDSLQHCIQQIETPNTDSLIKEVKSFFPTAANAVVIWYLGDLERLSGKYENPESLIWRDAGAMLATHSLVSEYLNLAYCPLGITGHNDAKHLSNKRNLMGLGVALIGKASG